MIYVASRVRHADRWKRWRSLPTPIISTWIDEAGEGETPCLTGLWGRILDEVRRCDRLVLYAEPGDFPLKGALVEAGAALAMGKPVTVCLPGVDVDARTGRPVGSWVNHRLVRRTDDLFTALTEGVR